MQRINRRQSEDCTIDELISLSTSETSPVRKGNSPLLPSWRATLCFAGMLGGVLLYSMRVNMSLAIVCMVRDPINNQSNVDVVNVSDTSDECRPNSQPGSSSTRNQGEFLWDRNLRGLILSSFFIGYLMTQLLGGWLARRYSGKRVVAAGVTILMITTFLIPIGARTNPNLVIVLRVIGGIGSGVYFPAFNALWAKWAPPDERTKLFSIVLVGNNLGSIILYSTSGFLCAYGFDGGWPSIFYIFGFTAVPWLIFWFLVVADSPAQHPRISERERHYIEKSLGITEQEEAKKPSTPWLAIITSIKVWCMVITHFCYGFAGSTIISLLPTYMKDVLKFDITANGLVNAIQYVSALIVTFISASVADKLVQKNVWSMTNVRKFMQTLGFVPPAIVCFGIGYIGCELRVLAVVLLCIAVGMLFCGRCGVLTAIIDIAPRFSGELLGISNTMSTLAGILNPLASSALTPTGSQEQWRMVFFMTGGVLVFGELVFMVFGTSEIQPWAKLDNSNDVKEVTLEMEKPTASIQQGSNTEERITEEENKTRY